MVKKKRQEKNKKVEGMIKKKVIKDKNRQRALKGKISSDMEHENSLEGIIHQLRIWGETTTDYARDKGIIAETLLRLPVRVRKKTLDEVIFVIVTKEGLTTKLTFPIKLQKSDIKRKKESYHAILEHPLVVLNFKRRMNKSKKMDTIAHEIAHFILGHYKIQDLTTHKKNINERKADDLAEKWGFKRCYKDYVF